MSRDGTYVFVGFPADIGGRGYTRKEEEREDTRVEKFQFCVYTIHRCRL